MYLKKFPRSIITHTDAEFEITCSHRPFSIRLIRMADRKYTWLVVVVDQSKCSCHSVVELPF